MAACGGLRIARLDDFYLICAFDTEDGAPHFTFPAGSGDLARAVRAMAEVAAALHQPLVIGGLTAQTLSRLEACFPGCFALENQRDSADYLYDTRNLSPCPERNTTKSAITSHSSPSMALCSRR